MIYYRVSQNSELMNRILKAEEVLSELNLEIGYTSVSEGIHITDKLTGNKYYCRDIEYTFPRCCEASFIRYEDK